MSKGKRILLGALLLLAVPFLLPEWPRIPVAGATAADWNPATFWYEPWGASGVHKGIDIFAKKGRPVIAPTYGITLFSGEIARGGQVVALLGPKLRIHYFAHLDATLVYPGEPVRTGSPLGRVGDSGNAKGKPAHLHYSVLTLVPYPWRADGSTQGWKKMFYLDPFAVLGVR
jgi:peptidoglycan LD-endopeptidase LytH